MGWRLISAGVLAVLLTLVPGEPSASGGDRWRLVSDRVMGGVSAGRTEVTDRAGRACLRMLGDVSLENNGGFIQIVSDITEAERPAFRDGHGVELDVYGNDESYNVHLRTEGMRYPWQSYRASFLAVSRWQTIRLPFADFQPHRVDGELQQARVQRIGVVAIGRAFAADLCVAGVRVYRN